MVGGGGASHQLPAINSLRSVYPCDKSGVFTSHVRAISQTRSSFLSGDDVGIALAAASFTAGGTETLSVSREAGHSGLIQSRKVNAVFEALSHESVKIC
jgi:hypothetical protein